MTETKRWLRNIAIGHEALTSEDTYGGSTAVGYRALQDQNASANPFNTVASIPI